MKTSDIHVVAGVLLDSAGRVLVAQRPAGRSMAGAWEFPGGKLKPGETRFVGLVRELNEELGIHVDAASPLIRYEHLCLNLRIDLDVWRVTRWRGFPVGCEGQVLAWESPDMLLGIGLLRADAPIVQALQLPTLFPVTASVASEGEEVFLSQLGSYDADLICLRRPDLGPAALLELAVHAAREINGSDARLILHGDPKVLAPRLLELPTVWGVQICGAIVGLHVPTRYLASLATRPVPRSMWFGVSCHDAKELDAALALDADYAFLGPVKPTASHPGEPGIGWEKFAALVQRLPLPVYAIGGLGPGDLETAWAAGAQGIAAIRGLWPG